MPLLFSILEHISPPPMLRDPWTQCVQMITEMAEITVDSVYTDYSCYNCQWHHTGWGARPTPCYHPSSHQPQCIIISSCNHIVLSSCNLITVSFYSMLTTPIESSYHLDIIISPTQLRLKLYQLIFNYKPCHHFKNLILCPPCLSHSQLDVIASKPKLSRAWSVSMITAITAIKMIRTTPQL